jgi:uncharacterized protein (DUF1800 family)
MADDVGLLLRRAGFGPAAADLATARKVGYAATLAALIAPAAPDLGASNTPPPVFASDPFDGLSKPTADERAAASRQRDEQTRTMTIWWLDRLAAADHQAREKLVFFWHGHWATSVKKVMRPRFMLLQHETLRRSFDFVAMTHAMVRDPAMIFWLDGQLNTRAAPNENLARELMELFTLGIGNYTEQDVKEAGRAMTGWRLDFASATAFAPQSHDGGAMTILGTTKNFDATSLVDFLVRRERCPRFLAERLWYRYASSTVRIPTTTQEAVAAAFPDSVAMLRALLADEQYPSTRGNLVKQPVEWLVGAMRQLGLRLRHFPTLTVDRILNGLDRLGQVPFAPPSVGGWPAGASWLTPGTAHARLSLADRLTERVTIRKLDPESLATLLAVDTWTNRTYAALRGVTDPRRLVAIGLVSPEYLVT